MTIKIQSFKSSKMWNCCCSEILFCFLQRRGVHIFAWLLKPLHTDQVFQEIMHHCCSSTACQQGPHQNMTHFFCLKQSRKESHQKISFSKNSFAGKFSFISDSSRSFIHQSIVSPNMLKNGCQQEENTLRKFSFFSSFVDSIQRTSYIQNILALIRYNKTRK